MAKFRFNPLADGYIRDFAARLGTGLAPAGALTDNDRGKPVKLVGESRYGLCAAGEEIEGILISTEVATLDGYAFGTVRPEGRVWATAEGALAIGDYVVAGTVPPAGTKLAEMAPNTGAPVAGTALAVKKAAGTGAGMAFPWRVISLGPQGSGANGTVVLIERVN